MANLIITIISIALVAVAALMGAYYGGAAFLQGQAKARANAWLNQAQQIVAADNVWTLNNSGLPLTNGTAGICDLACMQSKLVAQYITSIPRINSLSWADVDMVMTVSSTGGEWLVLANSGRTRDLAVGLLLNVSDPSAVSSDYRSTCAAVNQMQGISDYNWSAAAGSYSMDTLVFPTDKKFFCYGMADNGGDEMLAFWYML